MGHIVTLEEEGEICQRCGKPYNLVWHAPDKLWKEVTGFQDGNGILCPKCFAVLVWEQLHTFLYWSCDVRLYPRHALFHHLRHWLRRLRIEAWLREQKTDK